jgi:ABC-type transport system involved in multi-copper enzyme maturation permease subunit
MQRVALQRWNPLRLLLRNPVVLKELRGRMRGPRAFLVLTGYLIVVGGFTNLFYISITSDELNTDNQFNGGEIGRNLFIAVLAMELFLVAFITPAFTSGAISGERERQTYDLLRTTLLPESLLLVGKLFSALAYVFLLLLAAIPLQSIAFLFGGVDLTEIWISLVVLVATSILLGNIGVYFSIVTRRTLRANMTTYVIVMGFMAITTLAVVVLNAVYQQTFFENREAEMLVIMPLGFFVSLNPVATGVVTQNFLVNQQRPFTIEHTFGTGETMTLPAPWIVLVIIYLVISALLFRMSVRQLKKIDD